MRVLDLGCGSGRDLTPWGVAASDEITGIDIDHTRLSIARTQFRDRHFVKAAGEFLPFANGSFDRVISAVALPYMNIQKALAEIHRVLVPGGGLSLSLHAPSFTIAELHKAIPNPIPTMFRLYVMANGSFFHLTGHTAKFFAGRTESFQTERGMRLALSHAGFAELSFRHGTGPAGERFIANAKRLASERRLATA